MKRIIKYKILPAIILLFVVAFSQSLKAQQMTGTFIMSSVGGIQNVSNNSMAITFNSSATCLNVQTGAAVLTGDRGTGNFAINCEVNAVFNSLGIKLYPNPVGANTKVKFINTPPLNDQFSISIWNAEGQQVGSVKATGFEIFQGKQIDLGSLSVGSYVIQIESEKYIDAIKFIKAN
ncbi:MAG: T9SS type A sorting domain-containing protein [Chitinophagaceae bacterium]|nr:T9SS type A sorting domain-containing protein [Chitinophagaceae bacterium]